MKFGAKSQVQKKVTRNITPTVDLQEFEAPAEVLILIAEVMLLLGATKEVSREAARTGRILIGEQRLLLACAPGDSALIICALLEPAWANPAARKALLQANAQLLLSAGVVAADGYGGPSLMCRWPLAKQDPIALSQWLQEFAAFAEEIQAKRH